MSIPLPLVTFLDSWDLLGVNTAILEHQWELGMQSALGSGPLVHGLSYEREVNFLLHEVTILGGGISLYFGA